MVGNNLKDTQLQQVVDKTIMIHDRVGETRFLYGMGIDAFAET